MILRITSFRASEDGASHLRTVQQMVGSMLIKRKMR